VFVETLGASASQLNFHRDYILPRKDTMPQVRVLTDRNYLLVTQEIPPGVIVEGNMLGKIISLKFANYNITDEQKFPEMEWENYLCTKSIPRTREIMLEP